MSVNQHHQPKVKIIVQGAGELLAQVRKKAEVKAVTIATALGVSKALLSKIEHNVIHISLDDIRQYLSLCGSSKREITNFVFKVCQ